MNGSSDEAQKMNSTFLFRSHSIVFLLSSLPNKFWVEVWFFCFKRASLILCSDFSLCLKREGNIIMTEKKQVQLYTPKYYALCAMGGVLACGLTHTSVVTVDILKCRKQVISVLNHQFWPLNQPFLQKNELNLVSDFAQLYHFKEQFTMKQYCNNFSDFFNNSSLISFLERIFKSGYSLSKSFIFCLTKLFHTMHKATVND
jgi:hypothetical protein